jgi:ribonuclease HI
MVKEKKYYVVWQGRVPGVYDTWQECKAQIDGFPAARYKGFPSKELAQAAFRENPNKFWGSKAAGAGKTDTGTSLRATTSLLGSPIRDSICVDAACNGVTGDMEYQGMYYKTGGLIFKQGPYRDGTNNIGEFLAIVHALGYCKKKSLSLPIYSDSRTAIGWVKYKRANTKLDPTPRNAVLFDLIERAEQWLRDNSFKNPILKWETKVWGENPADFGRK